MKKNLMFYAFILVLLVNAWGLLKKQKHPENTEVLKIDVELNEPQEYKYTIGLTHTDNFQDTIIVYSKEEPLLFNNHHKNYYILRVGLITYAVDLKSISVIERTVIK